MFIDGERCESETGGYFDAFDPSSMRDHRPGSRRHTRGCDRAVLAATAPQRALARMSVWDRARMLHRIADEMEKSKERSRARLVRRSGQAVSLRGPAGSGDGHRRLP